ncbi:hypothetical protein SODALDRAFT_326764 [Sodiomyces alkalinus F11]|uniref:Uncharacterized protein n=1 Tax=Sodiomyces alkalinus (strain CBS 110278 / VKM F-3762 / F11) TaxID=1314773 RepID=A0A3N2Q7J5_SODAK|nr:hypothetical protein SODALDRAFT_326764 [Sodiomyces alkalinus F11]ROT42605.1 hypothetical protein SODALDRAFT_326764 [Sodiomyces alkalinus F11]
MDTGFPPSSRRLLIKERLNSIRSGKLELLLLYNCYHWSKHLSVTALMWPWAFIIIPTPRLTQLPTQLHDPPPPASSEAPG